MPRVKSGSVSINPMDIPDPPPWVEDVLGWENYWRYELTKLKDQGYVG